MLLQETLADCWARSTERNYRRFWRMALEYSEQFGLMPDDSLAPRWTDVSLSALMRVLLQDGRKRREIEQVVTVVSDYEALADPATPRLSSQILVGLNQRALKKRFPRTYRYEQTWDLDVLLNDRLRPVPAAEEAVREQALVLVASVSGARSADLAHIDARKVTFGPEGMVVWFRATKELRGEYLYAPPLQVDRYNDCPALCPVAWLERYAAMVAHRRPPIPEQVQLDEHWPMFLCLKSADPIKSATVARIFSTAMARAGIDTTIYKPHSKRLAVGSKAAQRGIPEGETMSRMRISSRSVYRTYYCRGVRPDTTTRALLARTEVPLPTD